MKYFVVVAVVCAVVALSTMGTSAMHVSELGLEASTLTSLLETMGPSCALPNLALVDACAGVTCTPQEMERARELAEKDRKVKQLAIQRECVHRSLDTKLLNMRSMEGTADALRSKYLELARQKKRVLTRLFDSKKQLADLQEAQRKDLTRIQEEEVAMMTKEQDADSKRAALEKAFQKDQAERAKKLKNKEEKATSEKNEEEAPKKMIESKAETKTEERLDLANDESVVAKELPHRVSGGVQMVDHLLQGSENIANTPSADIVEAETVGSTQGEEEKKEEEKIEQESGEEKKEEEKEKKESEEKKEEAEKKESEAEKKESEEEKKDEEKKEGVQTLEIHLDSEGKPSIKDGEASGSEEESSSASSTSS